MEGALAMTGSILFVIFLCCMFGYLWDKAADVFPSIRASRQEKKFKQGQEYATKLLSGNFDSDVRKRAGNSTMSVGEKERIDYALELLDESRCFGQGDNFDRGVESIIDNRLSIIDDVDAA